MSSTQNRSWTRSWPARPSMSASWWSFRSRTIAAASAVGILRRDEQPGDAVLDHLRDPADVRRDHRARERHRLEDRQALGLAVGRQHRDVERRRDGRDVVAAAGEDHVALDPLAPGDVVQRVEPAPLADDQQVGRRAGLQRPAATPRAASGGPSPAPAGRPRPRSATSAPCRTRRAACSTAPGGRIGRGRCRCRSSVRGAAVRPSATTLRSIAFDTTIRWLIDGVRRWSSSWSSPERTRDEWTVEITHGRRWPASPSAIAGLGAHDLRAVHVVVDDVGADVDQVRGEDPGRDGVVGLVDHAHRDPERARACARRCPATARPPRRRIARGPCARRGCRRAPARRRWCRSRGPATTRMRSGRRAADRRTGARQGL